MKKIYAVLSIICLISATAVIAEEIEIPGWSSGSTGSSYTTGSSSSSAYSSAAKSSASTASESEGTNSVKAVSSKTASTASSASTETADADGVTPSEVIQNVEKQTTSVHKSVKNVYDSVNMIKGIRF